MSFSEPFPRLLNQGQVIFGGASMSKSKGNIVEPMPLVERWGADTMRVTMLFAGPFEDDIDWKLIAPEPERRPAVNAWLGRVFAAVSATPPSATPRSRRTLRRLTHRTIEAVTDGPRAVPVQRGDLEAAGADERAAARPLDAGGGGREAATALVS